MSERAVEPATQRRRGRATSAFHPDRSPHPVHTVHRVGAASVGGFLLLFAAASLLRPVAFLPDPDAVVMGLATSGLLATASVIVGAVLVAAGVHGGPAASSVSVVVGAVFLLSGMGNALVLGTAMNMLGFRLSNILFSLAVGLALLLLGAYGRFTGSLPDDSPYAGPPAVRDVPEPVDAGIAAGLADAERAAARHAASARQTAGIDAAAAHRTQAARRHAYAASTAGASGATP